MIVELRHCDLEIAHIGTREQIDIEIFYENLGIFVDHMLVAFQILGEAVNRIADQILATFESEAGKELLKRCERAAIDRPLPAIWCEEAQAYYAGPEPMWWDEKDRCFRPYSQPDNIHQGHSMIWDEKERCWKAEENAIWFNMQNGRSWIFKNGKWAKQCEQADMGSKAGK